MIVSRFFVSLQKLGSNVFIFILMNRLFWILLILVLVIVLTYVLSGFSSTNGGFKTVDNDEFEQIVSNTDSVVLLDVRTLQEYNEGHIRGALLIDVKTDSFMTAVSEKLPKDKIIAVYCRSGRRSVTAANMLVSEGYTVVNLKNGITGWMKDNREVVR